MSLESYRSSQFFRVSYNVITWWSYSNNLNSAPVRHIVIWLPYYKFKVRFKIQNGALFNQTNNNKLSLNGAQVRHI